MCGAFDLWPFRSGDVLPDHRQGGAAVQREEECGRLQGAEGWHRLRRQSVELLRRVRRSELPRVGHDTGVVHDDNHEAAINPDDDATILRCRVGRRSSNGHQRQRHHERRHDTGGCDGHDQLSEQQQTAGTVPWFVA